MVFHVEPNIVLSRTFSKFRVYSWPKISEWLNFVAISEGVPIEYLSYTLMTDNELLDLNRKSLNHDYYTDILTFDLSEKNYKKIIGDIYISLERVKDNSIHYETHWKSELNRVFVHGLLHLIGYSDKGKKKTEMRRIENKYLEILENKFHVKQQ
jgi:probable rRNA maturation factor